MTCGASSHDTTGKTWKPPEELAEIDKALGKLAIHGDRKDSDIVKLGTVQSVILE